MNKQCCESYNGMKDITNSCIFCKTYIPTYTEKRLEEFDEKMVRLNKAKITGHISGRHIFQWNDEETPSNGDQYEDSEYNYLDEMLRTLFAESIQQALAEERARVIEESTLYFRVRQIPLSEEFINIINPKDKDI